MQSLPSGRTTLIFRTDIRLFMSLWMLSATPGYWEEEYEKLEINAGGEKQELVVGERVWIPGSSWRFLCRLLTLHDAPVRWTLQQTVCPRKTIACLSTLGPAPPPELSTQSQPHTRQIGRLKSTHMKLHLCQLISSCQKHTWECVALRFFDTIHCQS